jgi:hypothetical protein
MLAETTRVVAGDANDQLGWAMKTTASAMQPQQLLLQASPETYGPVSPAAGS